MAKRRRNQLKKLFIIGGIIIATFVLIIVLSNQSNKSKLKNNPYDTEDLRTSTISLIGNEHYSNIILPKALAKKIESNEPVTAYFFSPECGFCMEMTPQLMPIAKEMNVQILQYNLLEYSEEAASYKIEATPTLIHFENGEEVARMVGLHNEQEIRDFLNDIQ